MWHLSRVGKGESMVVAGIRPVEVPMGGFAERATGAAGVTVIEAPYRARVYWAWVHVAWAGWGAGRHCGRTIQRSRH
jgi:hypothetical protein